MAIPQQTGDMLGKVSSLKGKDLNSLIFRWRAGGPYAVQPIATFTPMEPYIVKCAKLNVFSSAGNYQNDILISVSLGFVNNTSSFQNSAGLGTSIIDEVDSSMREFLNFTPDGFYLPVGREITLMSSAMNTVNPPPGMPSEYETFRVFGTVILYMLKSYE